jgi:hypothetical protein
VRDLLACIAFACLVTGTRPARALDRQAETGAKQALAAAMKDHAAGDDDGAILRLQRTRKACGSGRCSAAIRASILRDLGAFQFARGDHAKASASFSDALDIEPDLPWNAAIDAADVVAEWAAVKAERAALKETPPQGDFDHVPETEQAVDTPLPIYAELSTPGVAKVVVKYRLPGETEFKHRTLPRFGGGYGGTIPCQDVKRGLLRYFLQAFDSNGTPLANSGDVRHLYFVPIRWALSGEPPHLPGQSPPEACNGQAQTAEEAEAQQTLVGTAPEGSRYVRLWIGLSGALDMTMMPSGSDVCALTSALKPVSAGYYCTNPNGSDFPTRSPSAAGATGTPLLGKSGQSSGGITTGDVRLLVTIDYALSTHFLTGVRAGYVSQSYPGTAASSDGHGISTPMHAELRETYLFGRDPLARSGFAPYAIIAAGYAKFDTNTLSAAEVNGVVGTRPVLVWRMGGPFFAAAGGGARYAFSPRVAFLAGLKATLPFGSAGILPSVAPEVELHYGF